MNDEERFMIPLKIKLVKWLAMKFGAEPTTIKVYPPPQWEQEQGIKGKYLLYLSFPSKVKPKLKLVKVY